MSVAASPDSAGLARRVRQAVAWRSGSQIVAQTVAWGSTFVVIRLLNPSDYGLFAMTQVVMALLNLMNGYGVANALIRQETVTSREMRQVFGALILLNFGLAAVQFALAPVVADYYRQPAIVDVVRVQALLLLPTPFIALPYAILGRRMDFKRPAQVRLMTSVAGALTALACALSGWGIWTLVAAPMVMFYLEAVGMTIAARTLMWPSFRFRGAGPLLRYGGAMMLVQFFWFLQSQADVFIAGRLLTPHDLGVYTTALFLTQVLATKFVPPLNDVAFAAYSRLQAERDVMRTAFLKTVRLILLVVVPAYFGLAVTAAPLVEVVLGPKWLETAAVVPILAFAMPMLTLQILFAPATNALGKPGLAVKASIAGGIALPLAFAVGVHWNALGLAWAWLGGMAVLLAATIALSAPAIGVRVRDLLDAAAPALFAGAGMALVTGGMAYLLPPAPAAGRLAELVLIGAATYAALLLLFARQAVLDAIALVRARPAAA